MYKHIDYDKSHLIEIRGITDDYILSLGTIATYLHVKNFKIPHSFSIVPDIFSIPSHGILGRDFLKKFQCTLKYDDMTLTIHTNSHVVTLTLHEGPDENTFVVPPRCEVIRCFNITPYKNELLFAPTQELANGIYTSNTIINSTQPYIRIINTTNTTQLIDKRSLKTDSLDNYNLVEAIHNDTNRNETLLKLLDKNIPDNVRSDFIFLCTEFSDIFALDSDKMTVNNFYTQHLRILDHEPIYTKNYRLPHSQKAEIQTQVNTFLKNSLIEPSTSNYNSPVLIVPKKTPGKWRMCIDYRQVNKKIIADRFPLPRIDEILDGLGRARYFSILDLFQGFHQIPLDQESRDITSFSTDTGSFRWKVLPFGLNVAPNSFTRMMSIAFSGLTPTQCFVYMDDLIVIGISEHHHLNNLRSVFDACKKFNLKLNPYKCQFFRPEVTYLGHKCTKDGVRPDESKLKSIHQYPTPTDKDSVKRFVAFANYYRKFIQHFASISAPLNKLTRKNTPFIWTKECNTSFQTIKNALITPPILQYPDMTKQFTITVDASKYGTGAILSQSHNNHDLPIAYASKRFTKGESNKPTIEQELIAIHFGIKHFRPYVYGSQFIVKSDHRPLVYLFGLKDPSSKLTRIRLELEEYVFIVEHIRGKDNAGADALSRISIQDLKNLNTNTAQVLVLTRSMTTKLNKQSHIDSNSPDYTDNSAQAPNMHIYEELGLFDYNKTPKLQLISDINHYILVAYYKKRIIIKIWVPKEKLKVKVNENINMKKNKNENENENEIHYMNKNTNKRISMQRKENSTKQTNENKKTSNTIKQNDSLTNRKIKEMMNKLNNEIQKHKIYKMHIISNDLLFQLIPNIDDFKNIVNDILTNATIIITNPIINVENEYDKYAILQKYHDNPIHGGHCGQKRLYAHLRSKYYWKNMNSFIKSYVRTCHQCQINKSYVKTKERLTITQTPQKQFDIVTIDTIGPLPISEQGNRYAVTMICNLTKYLITAATPNKDSKTVAKAIFDKFILIFGPMKDIITDKGTEYKNQTLEELCTLFHIDLRHSTAHHHETVGIIERNHKTLNEYLRTYLNDSHDNWETCLYNFTYCYNITPNSSLDLKFTPYELVFGKKPNNSLNFDTTRIEPCYNLDNFSKELKYKLQIAHSVAKELLEITKRNNKAQYDRNVNPIILKINDNVLVRNNSGKKLDNVMLGPFIVNKVLETNVELLDKVNNKKILVHKNRIRKYHSR